MAEEQRAEDLKIFARTVDFGRAASDYAQHRAGFPDRFFDRLVSQLGLARGLTALDLGTGTGTVARGLASRGLTLTALDPSPALMEEARALDAQAGVSIDYHVGKAERLPFADASFDLVTAGQCWHWFDRPTVAHEVARILKPGGALVIAHFDWLPLPGNMVEATYNPAWTMGHGTGLYPQWLADMSGAGFAQIETTSFDMDQPYTPEGWRGRIRASAGVKASLDEAGTARFDADLAALLAKRFPADPLMVPHRIWWASARKP